MLLQNQGEEAGEIPLQNFVLGQQVFVGNLATLIGLEEPSQNSRREEEFLSGDLVLANKRIIDLTSGMEVARLTLLRAQCCHPILEGDTRLSPCLLRNHS